MAGFFVTFRIFRLLRLPTHLSWHRATMSGINTHNLYKGKQLADFYLKYRPGYPDWVHQEVIDDHMKSSGAELELAVDVGCGTGQVTNPLARYFKQVIGVDISPYQIDNCPKNLQNVSFHVGVGEDMSFIGSGTVDLVTVATALHWLDISRFYQEVDRILKPGGSLVVLCFPRGILVNDEAEEFFQQVFREKIAKHFAPGDKFCTEFYPGVFLPFEAWTRKMYEIKEDWSVDRYVGYLASFSFVTEYMKEQPNEDFLGDLKKKFLEILNKKKTDTNQVDAEVSLKFTILKGRKPTPDR